jgi:hypothetical protein
MLILDLLATLGFRVMSVTTKPSGCPFSRLLGIPGRSVIQALLLASRDRSRKMRQATVIMAGILFQGFPCHFYPGQFLSYPCRPFKF